MTEQVVFDALKYHIEVDVYGNRWYYNPANQLHRTDGPAVTDTSGNQWWYQNGLLHRTNGPAIISKTGVVSFWLNGEYMTTSEYDCTVKCVK